MWMISLISAWPGWSAGCALPAYKKMSGRLLRFISSLRRSMFLNNRCARLYVAKRRANPITNASGRIFSIVSKMAEGFSPLRVISSRNLIFTLSKSLFFRYLRTLTISASGISRTPSHFSRLDWSLRKPVPRCFTNNWCHSLAIQVG